MPIQYGSPPFSLGGVDCALFVGSDGDLAPIRESWNDAQGLVVQVDFILRWSDRLKFLQALSGSSSYAGGKYTRKLPEKLPQIIDDKSPGLDGQPEDYQWYRFTCSGTGEMSPKGWRTDIDGSITGAIGWGYYELVVIPTMWSVPTYIIDDAEFAPDFPGADMSGFPFTTTQIKAAGESYSPFATGYKFSKSGDQIDDAKVGLVRPTHEITIVRHFMPFVDAEKYNALVGTINSAPFKFGNAAFDIGSILYMGWEYESRPDVSTGALTYDIIHHLVAKGEVEDVDDKKNSSWNWFVSPNGKWDQVVTTTGEDPVYSESDMHLDIWPEYAD